MYLLCIYSASGLPAMLLAGWLVDGGPPSERRGTRANKRRSFHSAEAYGIIFTGMLILKELLITFNLVRDNFNGYYTVEEMETYLTCSSSWAIKAEQQMEEVGERYKFANLQAIRVPQVLIVLERRSAEGADKVARNGYIIRCKKNYRESIMQMSTLCSNNK